MLLLQTVMRLFILKNKCCSARFPCFQNFCTEHVRMKIEIRVEFIMHRSSGGRDFLRQHMSQEYLNSFELSFEMQDESRNLHFLPNRLSMLDWCAVQKHDVHRLDSFLSDEYEQIRAREIS
jgi:hypothetical protein